MPTSRIEFIRVWPPFPACWALITDSGILGHGTTPQAALDAAVNRLLEKHGVPQATQLSRQLIGDST